MKRNKIYIAWYGTGDYNDGYEVHEVFATQDLAKAQEWADKFNRMRGHWQRYIRRFADEGGHLSTEWASIKTFPISRRYYTIRDLHEAEIKEIEIR